MYKNLDIEDTKFIPRRVHHPLFRKWLQNVNNLSIYVEVITGSNVPSWSVLYKYYERENLLIIRQLYPYFLKKHSQGRYYSHTNTVRSLPYEPKPGFNPRKYTVTNPITDTVIYPQTQIESPIPSTGAVTKPQIQIESLLPNTVINPKHSYSHQVKEKFRHTMQAPTTDTNTEYQHQTPPQIPYIFGWKLGYECFQYRRSLMP